VIQDLSPFELTYCVAVLLFTFALRARRVRRALAVRPSTTSEMTHREINAGDLASSDNW
jgi:hypothetical protein